MDEIETRIGIKELYAIKVQFLTKITQLEAVDRSLRETLEQINSYCPYRLEYRYDSCNQNREEQEIDRDCWRFMIKQYELEKYILCTDYEKLQKEIEQFKAPVFTIENAEGWVLGLKALIHENVKTLIHNVFEKITQETYQTGGSWNNCQVKKRNNNGIDRNFIITTHDYSRIFSYWRNSPTVTDDLEKACYILDGKKIPDITLMSQAKHERVSEVSNDYFTVKFCKNGNTHYTLQEEIREKLNKWGPTGNIIGEDIKIKVFEKGW